MFERIRSTLATLGDRLPLGTDGHSSPRVHARRDGDCKEPSADASGGAASREGSREPPESASGGAASREGEFVVFVLGMRINAWWAIHRWLPVFAVAPRMVRELRADPDSGLLGSWGFSTPPRTFGFVQYWESFESLRAYARDSDRLHLDAWEEYNRDHDDGSVGIFHETYVVEDYETVYNNVPPRGLGAADGSTLVTATGELRDAAGRLDGDGAGDPATGEDATAGPLPAND